MSARLRWFVALTDRRTTSMASPNVARPPQPSRPPRPATSEYAPFYGGYITMVPDGDLIAHLDRQARETVTLLQGVNEDKSRFRYAPGKWTIREVIGHLNDVERVFAY